MGQEGRLNWTHRCGSSQLKQALIHTVNIYGVKLFNKVTIMRARGKAQLNPQKWQKTVQTGSRCIQELKLGIGGQ